MSIADKLRSKRQCNLALRRLINGEIIVLSDHTLEGLVDYYGNIYNKIEVVSARNRNQIGTLDSYVVWARAKSSGPKDLEYKGNHAVASVGA